MPRSEVLPRPGQKFGSRFLLTCAPLQWRRTTSFPGNAHSADATPLNILSALNIKNFPKVFDNPVNIHCLSSLAFYVNQITITFFLHVTATLHREPIIWDAFQATSFGTYTGHEILIFKRFQGWLFIKRAKSHRTHWWNLWWPQPQVFMTSWNLLISIGQLNCEETITRISVALSCLSWGCFCSRDSVSAFKCLAIYTTDAADFIIYLKDQNVALS